MRPRDATRSLKAITCVNNTQNSQLIIAFVTTQVQRDLLFNGAVVAAARSSSCAWGATAGTSTVATSAALRRAGGNCQRPQSDFVKAQKVLPIIEMLSAPDAPVVAGSWRPWPINLPPKTNPRS
jgi:hypothetical protein